MVWEKGTLLRGVVCIGAGLSLRSWLEKSLGYRRSVDSEFSSWAWAWIRGVVLDPRRRQEPSLA